MHLAPHDRAVVLQHRPLVPEDVGVDPRGLVDDAHMLMPRVLKVYPIGAPRVAPRAVSGATTPTCAPASGSVFALGATTVTCAATDQAGYTDSTSFTVTAKGAGQQVGDLLTKVQSLPLDPTARKNLSMCC